MVTIVKGDIQDKTVDYFVISILARFYNRVSIYDNEYVFAWNRDEEGNETSSLTIANDFIRLNGFKYHYDSVDFSVRHGDVFYDSDCLSYLRIEVSSENADTNTILNVLMSECSV